MASGFSWIREAMLAGGLVVLVLISMWVATGSFPPMVVVESGSMMPVSYTHLTLPTKA